MEVPRESWLLRRERASQRGSWGVARSRLPRGIGDREPRCSGWGWWRRNSRAKNIGNCCTSSGQWELRNGGSCVVGSRHGPGDSSSTIRRGEWMRQAAELTGSSLLLTGQASERSSSVRAIS